MAMDRIKQIGSHLSSNPQGVGALLAKSPDDVVITLAIRSPLCKAKKGGLKDTTADELLLEMFKETITRSGVPASAVQDICVGTVLTSGSCYQARSAALAAGYPESVPVQTIHRLCSSGLMAVTSIANQIRAGQIQIGLAIGVESMSQSGGLGSPPPASSEVLAHSSARDAQMPMGWTSENVAGDFAISREDMDAFAAMSFQRAEHAQQAHYFDAEIVPINAYVKDPATGSRSRTVVSQDDGIRRGTTADDLAKIRSAFPQWSPGFSTGGNSSQITDGVAAVMLMTRAEAERLRCPILGKWVTTSVAGLAPRIMGIGPAIAIPMVLKNAGITKDDVDLFEINEAFASMYVYCVRKLGLDHDKVNVNGGAIALGHPVGCTGARQVATGLHELRRRKGKILVTSMCIGTGMGAAAVFVGES